MKTKVGSTQFFFSSGRINTIKTGDNNRGIFRANGVLLGENDTDSGQALLATSLSESPIMAEHPSHRENHSYSPYGYDPITLTAKNLAGFNGEQYDTISKCYLLGSGYRLFNLLTMRFNSPDNLSPFYLGGLNSYCYCTCDPINNIDRTGHFSAKIKVAHRNRQYNYKQKKRNLNFKIIQDQRHRLLERFKKYGPFEPEYLANTLSIINDANKLDLISYKSGLYPPISPPFSAPNDGFVNISRPVQPPASSRSPKVMAPAATGSLPNAPSDQSGFTQRQLDRLHMTDYEITSRSQNIVRFSAPVITKFINRLNSAEMERTIAAIRSHKV
ncbi:RHS repeat-associated core domain-containing protein [Pseudomonas sp. S37]|uniref:RHS repeat-associated core domain-containing protein n=1 Tax=Pseudomonas sp. S37 TaxID=2767449 RepID=UPI001F34C23B|nr:RHS repeat-associated core domain-containing protein [Pseudomonas sp. S37]MBK4996288.1 RHS repeat-associated core domain-containing protein [Pseudomonas sp. S37]